MKNIKNLVQKIKDQVVNTAKGLVNRIVNMTVKQKLFAGATGLVILMVVVGLIVITHKETVVTTVAANPVVTEDVKAGELVTPDKVEQTKPAEVVKPVEPELTTEEKEQAKQVIEPAVVSIPDGGAIANPNVNQSQTTAVVPDSRGPVEEPNKPTQQPEVVVTPQPVTPRRPSGAEMTNTLRGCTFNRATNNSDVNSPQVSCTPTFLSNAMPIIDSFIAGGLDEGSARSQLNSLNHTGDAVDDYGLTVITDIYSITVCNGRSPASEGISGILNVSAYIGGAGVVNVTVTYDSSSDTYLTRGICLSTGVQNK